MFKHYSEPSPALIKFFFPFFLFFFFFFGGKTPIHSDADLAPSRPDMDTDTGVCVCVEGGGAQGHCFVSYLISNALSPATTPALSPECEI